MAAYQCAVCGEVTEQEGACSCSFPADDWVAIGNAYAELGRRLEEAKNRRPLPPPPDDDIGF